MANYDITQTTTSSMDGALTDFSVQAQTTDGGEVGEQYYDNTEFSKWYGYYKEMPQLKKAIDAFATWVLGKGYECALSRDKAVLEGVTGRGDEDFLSILWNMKVIAKINGDSYAEIMRNDKGTFVNLKPLNPMNMRVVYSPKGIITAYEDLRTHKRYKTQDILHFTNDRTADELGGTSVVPVVKWAIDARQEAMEGYRRILHRSTIRVLYVEENNTARLAALKRDYKDAINKGELLILPGKKEDAGFEDLTTPPVQSFLDWIRHLENFIYIAVGIPKVIMGSVDSIPESGGKISYLTYEQIYSRETREMEADLWNQLAIRITFNPPASIAEGVADERNTAQTGFQPNDVQAGVGK